MGNGAVGEGRFWVIGHVIGGDVLVVELEGDGLVKLGIYEVTVLQEVHVLLLRGVEVILILTHSHLNN